MAQTEHLPRISQSRLTVAIAAAALAVAVLFGVAAGPAWAGQSAQGAPTADAAPAQPGQTTSTLPTDNRTQGNSITRPNQGADPLSPSDPGGWLQVSLFYLICVGVFGMAGLVWLSSRRARARQVAAGQDPLTRAKVSGKGVRAPSPLDHTPGPTTTDHAATTPAASVETP